MAEKTNAQLRSPTHTTEREEAMKEVWPTAIRSARRRLVVWGCFTLLGGSERRPVRGERRCGLCMERRREGPKLEGEEGEGGERKRTKVPTWPRAWKEWRREKLKIRR